MVFGQIWMPLPIFKVARSSHWIATEVGIKECARALLLHPSCWKQQISRFVLSPQEAFLGCLVFLVLTMSFPSPHYVISYLRHSHTPFFMCSRRCEFHCWFPAVAFPISPQQGPCCHHWWQRPHLPPAPNPHGTSKEL